MRRAALVLAVVLAASGGMTAAGAAGNTSAAAATATASIAQLIGQKLMVRMDGLTPSASLLGRIRRGEVGGVILFGANVSSASQLRSLTAALQSAAKAGGQPHLLIAVDQEGGSIKRIPWAPPTLSPPQMGTMASNSVAQSQGAKTGDALLGLGIDVDLAPVADVPVSTSSFLYRQGRTFSFNAARTEWLANSFATGLERHGVSPAMKHFPGLGFATQNTDQSVVTINASRSALAPGLLPYRMAISRSIPIVMLSNATYPAWDPAHAAGWSPAIAVGLLRGTLGFKGVSMTDSLDGAAHARGLTTRTLGLRAAQAGTDMILTTGSESTTAALYAYLVREAEAGVIATSTLRSAYARILALKAAY